VTSVSLARSYFTKARKRLRAKEREFAFYGDEDFIPTEEYPRQDAGAALDDARFVAGLLGSFPTSD
jgi:hypothetical protein